MKITLLKTPIFKLNANAKGEMVVPGFVDFTQESVDLLIREDWYLCNKIRNHFTKIRENLSNLTNDFNLKFRIESPYDEFVDAEPGAVVELADQSTILEKIKGKLFPMQVVQFEATVSILGLHGTSNQCSLSECYIEKLSLGPEEMTVDDDSDNTSKFCCNFFERRVPEEFISIFHYNGGQLFATITVSMTISQCELDQAMSPADINQKIFNDELDSDTVIIPGSGGNPVKCHKSFLMANSPVFYAMFQTDMDESKSGEVKIQEMDEDVARAFLAYLYCRDESKADSKFGIAFQLLLAGHKYQIPDLINAMSALLVRKPVEWYDDVDLAVKQYLFARNLEDGEGLKTKALISMKTK